MYFFAWLPFFILFLHNKNLRVNLKIYLFVFTFLEEISNRSLALVAS